VTATGTPRAHWHPQHGMQATSESLEWGAGDAGMSRPDETPWHHRLSGHGYGFSAGKAASAGNNCATEKFSCTSDD
jgi:hypothetical protein